GTRQHGMLEAVASGPGVVATAQRLGMSGRITAKRVFDEARDGDAVAVRAVAHEADHVARALAGVIALLDPELVVLGGEIRGHDAILLGAVGDPSVPSGVLERGLLLKLRFELDHYINLRPVRLYPGVATPLAGVRPEDIDMMVVREGTEGPYAGAGGVLR